jgi:hypothetical protein
MCCAQIALMGKRPDYNVKEERPPGFFDAIVEAKRMEAAAWFGMIFPDNKKPKPVAYQN